MITIVDYGTSNMASVCSAFDELGEDVAVAATPEEISRADRLVLPGVGAMPYAMELLRNSGLIEAIEDAVLRRAVPYLGICLGMQMMAERSWEFDVETTTLGWVQGETVRLKAAPPKHRVPNMGWAELTVRTPHPLLDGIREGAAFYFCHSYAVEGADAVLAQSEHGAPVAAILGDENRFGVQFHPERSGPNGLRLLENFLDWTRDAVFRVIPTMLLSRGRLVKGRAFASHEDAGNPETTARVYNDQLADEILVLDIDATRDGRSPQLETLSEIARNCFVPISFGGGVASVEVAAEILRRGADKVVVNTHALEDFSLVDALARRFGSQAVVAAVDYRRVGGAPTAFTHNGSKRTCYTVQAAVDRLVEHGAGEILLTDIDREGTRNGPDCKTIAAISARIDAPVIAHGGVGSLDDFARIANETGAGAVGAGRVFQFADFNLIKVRRYLAQCGVSVRRN